MNCLNRAFHLAGGISIFMRASKTPPVCGQKAIETTPVADTPTCIKTRSGWAQNGF